MFLLPFLLLLENSVNMTPENKKNLYNKWKIRPESRECQTEAGQTISADCSICYKGFFYFQGSYSLNSLKVAKMAKETW
jgi:hypothetical protein